MKYYKKLIPQKWQVFAYEADGSQDGYISDDMVPITPEQAEQVASSNPPEPLVLDILRASSTQRNWSWPPKAYQEAIGQIAVAASGVEVLLRTVIWHVAGLDGATGRAFTGDARQSELVEMLKALIEIRAPELKVEVATIGARTKKAFSSRAAYMHQAWTVQDGVPVVGKLFSARYERLEKLTRVSLSDMYQLADEFKDIELSMLSEILLPLQTSQASATE